MTQEDWSGTGSTDDTSADSIGESSDTAVATPEPMWSDSALEETSIDRDRRTGARRSGGDALVFAIRDALQFA